MCYSIFQIPIVEEPNVAEDPPLYLLTPPANTNGPLPAQPPRQRPPRTAHVPNDRMSELVNSNIELAQSVNNLANAFVSINESFREFIEIYKNK